jgi:fatty acid desaturase
MASWYLLFQSFDLVSGMSKKIKGLLTKEQFAALHGGELRAYAVTLVLYLVLLGCFAALARAADLASLPARGAVAALAFLAIGWCQFSLSNGLHEALHRNFGNRRDDLPADLLLAYPLCVTTSSYREVHMAHHRNLGDPGRDPDWGTYTGFPRSRVDFLLRLGRYGSGLPAALQLVRQSVGNLGIAGAQAAGAAGDADRKRPRSLRPLLGVAAYQAGLFVSLSLALGPAYYLLFWLAPLATVGKLLSSCRALCEHGSPDRPFVIRTITGRAWDELSLGTYGFHYHGEHHLLPTVPYAHLGELHALHLAARRDPAADLADLDGRFEHYRGGYLGLMWRWFRRLPWRVPASP